MIDREEFFTLFNAAKVAGNSNYARMLASDWISEWPGDRDIQRALAQVEISQKRYGSAVDRLIHVTMADPEDREAYKLLAHALSRSGDPVRAATFTACAAALGGEGLSLDQAPSWYQPLMSAVRAIQARDFEAACRFSHDAVLADIHLPLPTLIALQSHDGAGRQQEAINFAQAGADRWPDTLAFRLYLGDELIKRGQPQQGMQELHRCVSGDPTGALANRYLGNPHPYASLWPELLTIHLSRPVPSDVHAVLGENQLVGAAPPPAAGRTMPKDTSTKWPEVEVPIGDQSGTDVPDPPSGSPQPEPWEAFDGPDPGLPPEQESQSLSEALEQVKNEFGRLASRINARTPGDSEEDRTPVYLAISSKTRLLQEVGESGFGRIDEALNKLVKAVQARQGWSARKVYIDDPASLKHFNLKPVDPNNAWQIKLRLGDIDQELADHGQMIGAVLIVGDHRIIPFHMLPNPTEDEDQEIPSDNPYATTDENYFVPEWMVGRLPSTDSDILTRLIRRSADEHKLALKPAEPGSQFRNWLAAHFGRFFGIGPQSVGYTASIWRRASLAVFRSIGEPGNLMASPPVEAQTLPTSAMKPTTLSYYNLHGLEDAAEWYGQRDPFRDRASGDEFPIALRIEDVVNGGRAPKIVFTEACYGANILDKTPDTALSLRFLDQGSHAVIGSTKISYGSVTPPLIAADYLGRQFWENLNKRLPVGEALRRAKLSLANEMHQRQGYLDGEDQKALISFILLGDPLYRPRNMAVHTAKKTIMRRTQRPSSMKTACAKGGPALAYEELDETAQARLKSIVSQYLPGMQGATCTIHAQHHGCDAEDHTCPSHQLGMKGLPQTGQQPMVVTLSKTISSGERQHPHYARLTLDPEGKVLKLAVSR
ncbi:MAG: C25 family cysteine peptidase [Anaerolineales bacterium]